MRELLTVIDVFAGAGGLSLGFEQAGFFPALGVDVDQRAMEAYAANFPEGVALPADAGQVSGSDLLKAAGLSSCAIVVGGPPCAAFSVGGVRRTDDERRGLVWEFARIVREVGPRYFMMENVPGILLPGARAVVQAFRQEMEHSGYHLAEPWILDASDFGVPQRRRRVFMIGARSGLPLPEPPDGLGTPPPTAREAIGDLEPLEDSDLSLEGEVNCALGPPSTYSARLRGRRPSDTNGATNPLALTGCERVKHSADVEKRFRGVPPGTSEPISRFFRLHPDRPARTIRAGTLSGRGGHTAPRPIHYAFPRCITVREAARLQSMPDWFRVDRTKWRGYMQVGNAVPPLLARAVADALRRTVTLEEADAP